MLADLQIGIGPVSGGQSMGLMAGGDPGKRRVSVGVFFRLDLEG